MIGYGFNAPLVSTQGLKVEGRIQRMISLQEMLTIFAFLNVMFGNKSHGIRLLINI